MQNDQEMAGSEGDGAPEERTPVTVLTGALGAGKTTLLKHILENPHGYRVAVIQNEFSEEMGMEAPLFTDSKGETIKDVYELPNGCLCCSAKDGLISMLDRLLEERQRFDYVLVEATGVADPESICDIFWVDEGLGCKVYLDGVVTLVDSRNALSCFGRDRNVKSEQGGQGEGGEAKGLGLELEASKQVACADVLILNKTDLTSEADRARVTALVRGMNPIARLLESSYSVVPLAEILGLKAFDRSRLQASLSVLQASQGGIPADTDLEMDHGSGGHGHGHSHDHGSDSNCAVCKQVEEGKMVSNHGIESILLRCEAEFFDPEKVRSWMAEVLWEGSAGYVYRCKGLFKGLSEEEEGSSSSLKPAAYALQGVGKLFEIEEAPGVSVAQSKLLFIGRGLKREILEAGLKGCQMPKAG